MAKTQYKGARYTLTKITSVASSIDPEKSKSITATLRSALSSEKQIELVAKLIRWKDVEEALRILKFTPKKAAKILEKVLKSAIANATNNAGLDPNSLKVARVDVGRGPKLKRIRFASRARIHPYNKYRSFVRVVLDIK